jgi:uncharacterized protein (DUF1697 family)
VPVYIALLRGINVGGSKVILMADLKKAFEKLDFSKVQTYIQSGNVVFASEKKSTAELENAIKTAIKSRFKFEVEVLVLGLDELERIVMKNPFDENKLKTGERIYFTILSQKASKEKTIALHAVKSSVDEFEIAERTVYVLCRKGYAKSAFNNGSIEKILKIIATSRNLETMKKLVKIGKGVEKDL